MSTERDEEVINQNFKDGNNIVDSLIVPEISIDSINKISKLIEKKKKSKNKKLMLGILKFNFKNIDYIHCPIKKIKDNGCTIKIGTCKKFKSLQDNKINRKILLSHFLHSHCNGEELCGENICNIKLKPSISIDEFIDKYIDNKERKQLKYDICKYCNSKFNKHY